MQGLLVLSGFSALALEIIYTRFLRYWVGNTAFATAVVLSSYMLGLAAGSFIAARILQRLRNLLVIYGALELCIGLYSLSFPWVLKFVETRYLRLSVGFGIETAMAMVGQFLVSMMVLLFPTLLMGMSFPIAVRAASGGMQDQPGVAEKLYAANLLGAASGALTSNFAFIPFWGLGTSLGFTAALNALVAAWAFILQSLRPAASATEQDSQPQAIPSEIGREGRVVIFVALAGGFLVLFQEIVWNHMIGEFLDNSAYGFAIMLFAVIAGLGVGAALSVRYLANRQAAAVLPWFCLGAGSLSLLLIPFWDSARYLTLGEGWSVFVAMALMLFIALILAPEGKGSMIAAGVVLSPLATILFMNWIEPAGSTFWVHHGADFCVSVLFMLAPAVLMGFIFPLVMQWYLEITGRTSRTVALVYGANTLGSLLGIVVATFLILPRLGIERSGRGVALALFALGIWLFARNGGTKWAMALAIVPAMIWAYRVPRWDFSKTHAALGHTGKMIFTQEDLDGGVTSVLQNLGNKQLYLNGLYEAGNDYEFLDQARCALIPMIHLRDMDRAMIIGLGSGQTAGIISTVPFKEIDIVDFSPGVVESSRRFFADLNLGVFADPRTRVHIADGRHYLQTHPEKLDLMTIEVSRLWVAGEGDLYTKEFYEIVSSRLTDRGVLQQWVPLFNLSRGDTLLILRTIRSVFPYVAFYMGAESGMVVASRQPLTVDYANLRGIDSRLQIQIVLQKLGMPSNLSLLGDCVLDTEGMDALMAREPDKRVSTDLWPYLEYSNARYYLGDRSAGALRHFLFNAQEFRLISITGADAVSEAAVRKLALEEHARMKKLVDAQ